MKQFVITTLGCKVNQCESAALESHLLDIGYRPGDGRRPADLVIVNTCTVTGKAAMQSRQAVRQAIRNHPGAQVVVTGCYAQTAPEELQSIPEVDLIVGHADKLNIVQILDATATSDAGPRLVHQPIREACSFQPLPSVAPDNRTRAFLKIQDGCNAFCTYCIVPHARGRSRSMPSADVLHHLQQLAGSGFREVVLTGIHLGAYGHDLTPPTSLARVLDIANRTKIVPRIRISSIEPNEIEPPLLALAQAPDSVVCPHFHIPLQSGDNAVLKRMGRSYTREQFADLILSIRRAMPFAAVGVDILSGFPGETKQAFERTYDLIEELPVTYLHVFPFSPRRGTPAATYTDQVPQRIVKERCRRLRRLGESKKRAFARSNVGQTIELLVETAEDAASKCPKGTSENYLTVRIPGAVLEENSLVPVFIERADEDGSVVGSLKKGQGRP